MVVQISLHDGTVMTQEVEVYNAVEIESKMNDPKLLALLVGNVVLNKNIIKYVAPVQA